jgi:hypothetical protein
MGQPVRPNAARALCFATTLLPSPALAAGGGASSDRLATVVTLVGFVAFAYLVTHFVVERLQKRFLFASGAEYLLLGVLLGPVSLGLLGDAHGLAQVLALAAGWVGLLYGMELDVRRLLSAKDGVLRLLGFEALGTGLLVAIVAHAFFRYGGFVLVSDEEAWMSAGVLGCTAAAGSSAAVDLVARHYTLRGGLIDLLRREARLSDLFAILAFGGLFCVFHLGDAATARPVTPTEWGALTVILGGVLGLLFTAFLGDDESPNARFLALVGIIAFASGAAWFLRLAPLVVNLVLGIVLVNTARSGPSIHETLVGTLRPMSLVLLVFAGLLWSPPDPTAGAIATVGYIALRLTGKVVGAYLASVGTELRGDLSRGLLAQGDVAVAMAVSWRLVYDGPAVDLAYTAILGSVIVHELVAPRALKGLLVDVGDVRGEAVAHG